MDKQKDTYTLNAKVQMGFRPTGGLILAPQNYEHRDNIIKMTFIYDDKLFEYLDSDIEFILDLETQERFEGIEKVSFIKQDEYLHVRYSHR